MNHSKEEGENNMGEFITMTDNPYSECYNPMGASAIKSTTINIPAEKIFDEGFSKEDWKQISKITNMSSTMLRICVEPITINDIAFKSIEDLKANIKKSHEAPLEIYKTTGELGIVGGMKTEKGLETIQKRIEDDCLSELNKINSPFAEEKCEAMEELLKNAVSEGESGSPLLWGLLGGAVSFISLMITFGPGVSFFNALDAKYGLRKLFPKLYGNQPSSKTYVLSSQDPDDNDNDNNTPTGGSGKSDGKKNETTETTSANERNMSIMEPEQEIFQSLPQDNFIPILNMSYESTVVESLYQYINNEGNLKPVTNSNDLENINIATTPTIIPLAVPEAVPIIIPTAKPIIIPRPIPVF